MNFAITKLERKVNSDGGFKNPFNKSWGNPLISRYVLSSNFSLKGRTILNLYAGQRGKYVDASSPEGITKL
jgi:hypothetical protein